jgi:membrane protease subunit HflK
MPLRNASSDEAQIRMIKNALRIVLAVGIVLAAVLMVASGFFTVPADGEAVITRMGAYNRTVESGLHMKWPMGLERLYRVPIKRQMKLEFGFRSTDVQEAEARSGGSDRMRMRYAEAPTDEAEILTGDLFVTSVEWSAQFHITNSREWLFSFRDPEATFADLNEAVMREVVGDRTFAEVLTTGRSEVQAVATQLLIERCHQYQLPIGVDQIVLQDVQPPEAVKEAFTEVNGALQEKETTINNALKDYNSIIPKAKGEAEAMIYQAEGYAVERTNNAIGEAERFTLMFKAYTNSPAITRNRMYLEAMGKLSAVATKKVIVDDQLPKGFIYAPALGK